MEKKKRNHLTIVVVFLLICLAGMVVNSFYEHTYVATVTDTNRITRNTKKHHRIDYIVFCEDEDGIAHEFKDSQCFLRGKFTSSKFFNDIEIGKKYEFKVVGFGMPIIRWRENIIAIKEVP